MMKNIIWILSLPIFFTCGNSEMDEEVSLSSDESKIEGVFEFNEQLNEPFNSSEEQRIGWTNTLDSLNISVIEEYIDAQKDLVLTLAQFDSSASEKNLQNLSEILSKDKFLSQLPERAMFSFYNFYFVNKHDLLFMPCISSFEQNRTNAIYMTEVQLEKLKPEIGKQQILEVELIERVERTQFTIYRLIQD